MNQKEAVLNKIWTLKMKNSKQSTQCIYIPSAQKINGKMNFVMPPAKESASYAVQRSGQDGVPRILKLPALAAKHPWNLIVGNLQHRKCAHPFGIFVRHFCELKIYMNPEGLHCWHWWSCVCQVPGWLFEKSSSLKGTLNGCRPKSGA